MNTIEKVALTVATTTAIAKEVDNDAMARTAMAYAGHAIYPEWVQRNDEGAPKILPSNWPWKPFPTRRANLLHAAALLIVEADRNGGEA